MYLIILFFIGLAIGSFLNVVSLRYTPDDNVFNIKNLTGRSRCPRCHHQLRWFELVPIFSFLMQRGRCRKCLMRIAPQYILIELLTGLVFVLVPYHFDIFLNIAHAFLLHYSPVGYYLEAGIFISAFLVLILIGIIDYRYQIIPNELNWSLAILGIALILTNIFFKTSFRDHMGVGMYAPIFNWQDSIWINRALGVLAGALITGLPVFISRGRVMGMGDFKLALALGLLFGWPNVVFILFGAFILGSIFGLTLIAVGRKRFRSFLPFAPFISTGTLVVVLWGETLLHSYFNLFGI